MLQFEKRINDIISQAASQMILESMLNKIKEFWSTQAFEFFQYQDKIQLIKNWTFLIEKSEEDFQQLNSMKFSSSFKIFETQIASWLDKTLLIS